MLRTLDTETHIKPGDEIRAAQAKLQLAMEELVNRFNADEGVVVTAIHIEYLPGSGENDSRSERSLIRVEVST